MVGEFQAVRLGELCRFSGGAGFPQRLQGAATGEYPFIKVSDMELAGNAFRITRANNWVDEATRRELRAKAHPANSTVFAKIGVALTYNRRRLLTRPTIVDNNMMAAIPDEEKVDPLFFYYLLKQTDFNEVVAGTALPYINASDLAKMEVEVPPLAQQKAIAAVLGALDDKIELNRRMNATLEAMARALFQSWFVDFDPVRAKLDGRPPAALDPATAALFPDSFQDSPLGQIPHGWEVKTIESLCDVITSGGTPARMHKSYWEPATVPWFKTGELLDGPLIDAEEKISEEGLANSSCKLWPAGTILFALYASPTVGRFGVLTKPGTANQAAAALIAKPAYGVPFLMGLLYEARAELQRVAVGAAQQNINQGVLKNHVVVAPPPALAKTYSDKVAPWFEQRIRLAEQSRTLATLRDTLLPKLLSGELSVAATDKESLSVQNPSRGS